MALEYILVVASVLLLLSILVSRASMLGAGLALRPVVHARRLQLGVDALWRFDQLAALHFWLLGLHGLRLYMGFEMALGLGSVSLRQMDFPQSSRMGVDAR